MEQYSFSSFDFFSLKYHVYILEKRFKNSSQDKILRSGANNRSITHKPQTLLVAQIFQRDSEQQHNIQ